MNNEMLVRSYSEPNPSTRLRKIKRIIDIVVSVLTAILMVILIFGVVEIKRDVLSELTDLHRVTLSIGGTAAEVRASAKVAEAASVEQRAYFAGISSRAEKVLDNSAAATAALTAMVQNTDHTVNAVLAPAIAATVKDNDSRMATLSVDADQTVKGMTAATAQATAAMTQGTAAMSSAARTLADPAIIDSLRHADATTANLDQMTAHLNASSAMIENKVRQMTKPASWAKSVGLAILDAGAKVAQIFTAAGL